MDPIGNLPIFTTLTKGMPISEIKKNVDRSVLVAAILLFAFLFFGLDIFNFFNIDLNSFQIAGGIILLIIGIVYVFGMTHKYVKAHGNDLSIPLGTPLLTGPGVITTIIILVKQNGMRVAFLASVLTLIATWVILSNSGKVYRFLGEHWTTVISRIMGIILAAVAVKFITNGVLDIISPLL